MRVWFNHWFSTAYNIIQLVKDDNPEYTIIGSHEKLLTPIMLLCDEWYQEPKIHGSEYVDYCVNFCINKKIDVFVPRKGMLDISKNKMRFEELGIKVLVDDYSLVKVLNNKDEAYDAFKRNGVGFIPEYYVINSNSEFEDAYYTLSKRYEDVCFKFVNDVGGKSYRKIDKEQTKKGYDSLFKKNTTRVSLEEAKEILSEKDCFSNIIVMPYLPGDEVSVDCLRTEKGLIAVPRIKDLSKIERIEYDDNLLKTCADILNVFPLQCPCNIQFKYLEGVPYLLEVNTRMSGGIQMACVVSEINIPSIAINKLLGKTIDWEDKRIEKKVSQVTVPVVL